MNTTHRFAAALLVALVIAMSGYFVWKGNPLGSASVHGRAPLYYQDAMHPWVKSDRPAKCAICACDLIPIFERKDDLGAAAGLVPLSSNGITVLNVRTEAVSQRPLTRRLRVAGTLEADNARKTIIGAPAPGRIDSISVESVGVDVERGSALATFYSPDLTFQTRRYIFRDRLPDKTNEFGPNPFTQAHSSRHQLAHPTPLRPQPAQDPFYNDLLSPLAGTVVERNVFEGQYVAEGDRLFTIVDCSVLWFRFDVYEQQLGWIEPGQSVEVTSAAYPGRVFAAVIAVIEPTLDDATRTVKVRANVDNPLAGPVGRERRLLQLGMYVEGLVLAQAPAVLTVPRSAVLYPGRDASVYVDHGDGQYQERHVTLGRQGDEHWEILAGLQPGERIVTAGNVLIDAQAQFNRSTSEQTESRGAPAPKVPALPPAARVPALDTSIAVGPPPLQPPPLPDTVPPIPPAPSRIVAPPPAASPPPAGARNRVHFGSDLRTAITSRTGVFGALQTNIAGRVEASAADAPPTQPETVANPTP